MFGSYESSSNYNRRYGRFNSELRGMACRSYESALRGSREFWRDNSLEKEETIIKNNEDYKIERIENFLEKEENVNKKPLKYIAIISAILGFLNMIFVVSLLFIPVINIIELNIIFFYFLLNFFLIPYTLSYSFLMYPSENKKIYFSIFLIQSIVSLYFIKTFFF